MSTVDDTGTKLVNEARKYIGTPYVYGGTTPSGFDCSGFIQYVYKQVGINITRTTITQIHEGVAVDKNNLQLGDIVFFGTSASIPDHEAMYVGDGKVIESPHTGDVVKILALSAFSDYVGARRINGVTSHSLDTSSSSGVSNFLGGSNLANVETSLLNGLRFFGMYTLLFILLIFILYVTFKSDNSTMIGDVLHGNS